MQSYLGIVKKQLQDQTTKIIMKVLVNEGASELNKALVSNIYSGSNVSYALSSSPPLPLPRSPLPHSHRLRALLVEAEDVALKRRICKEELEALKEAKKVLQMSEFFAI